MNKKQSPERLEYLRNYRKTHKEQYRKYQQKYYQSHKDYYKNYSTKYARQEIEKYKNIITKIINYLENEEYWFRNADDYILDSDADILKKEILKIIGD